MIKRILCLKLPTSKNHILLSDEETHHATHVLRLRDGDLVEAMDGNGNSSRVVLRTREGPVRVEWDELGTDFKKTSSKPDSQTSIIILEMAILKGPAMEWVIEKSVELGVARVIPVVTERTVVQIRKKGPELFRERWQKIANQALKQCGRLNSMVIEDPVELTDLVQEEKMKSARFWCDAEDLQNTPFILSLLKSPSMSEVQEFRILIGPEGGWGHSDRQALSRASKTHRVHLCENTLRAETAAIFSVSSLIALKTYLSI